jgi:hypothetical protein
VQQAKGTVCDPLMAVSFLAHEWVTAWACVTGRAFLTAIVTFYVPSLLPDFLPATQTAGSLS